MNTLQIFPIPHILTCDLLKDIFFIVVTRALIFKYSSESYSQACYVEKTFLSMFLSQDIMIEFKNTLKMYQICVFNHIP